MTPSAERIAPHMARFLEMLDAAFRRFGAADGLPERFRRAVAATPRHLFVHRYRVGDGALRTEADERLDEVYSDAVMRHVDAAGQALPSSNSQPSYVLWLLHLLDLRPGQRVLEVGSGSGWLAAVMARLVGEEGRVTGVEVIPALAAQSRADLAGLGIGTVSVVAGDGEVGHADGAPYDRAMITAAVWDVPEALFEQVAPGGLLLAPIELRGGGCHVASLRRVEEGFVAEAAVPGWFVPLLGRGQVRPERVELVGLPFWAEIAVARQVALPLATGPDGMAGATAVAFRAFVGRTVPGFAMFDGEAFGVVEGRSVAVWRAGVLTGHGGPGALRTMTAAYARWTSLGMPGMAGFALTVVRGPGEGERRGGSTLVWRCLPGAEDWQGI